VVGSDVECVVEVDETPAGTHRDALEWTGPVGVPPHAACAAPITTIRLTATVANRIWRRFSWNLAGATWAHWWPDGEPHAGAERGGAHDFGIPQTLGSDAEAGAVLHGSG
jgi:hypothetical protein